VGAADGVTLTVQKTLAPGEVRLDWSGGTPTYQVYRSAIKTQVVVLANKLGDTSGLSWNDVPPAGTIYYYRIVGPCITPTAEVCDGVDDDCNGFIDNGCPGTCADDNGCSPGEFCNSGGVCVSDLADGGSCSRDAQCDSSHCSQGVCCLNGDCCTSAAQCAAYSLPPTCNSQSTCQGTRADAACQNFTCTSQVVDDDSGCSGLLSNACGSYPPVFCTGGQTQPSNQAALCATACGGDGDCDVAAHCESTLCVDDFDPGEACTVNNQCQSLTCVDDVCCSSTCSGTCRACDLSGSAGTCGNVPLGQDVDAECGAVSCVGFYNGFVGSSCFRKADVSAAQATCNGAGACRTAAQECGSSGQGPSTLTCNATCQQPTAGTCTGTTAGACTNLNPGNTTCGVGLCQRTVATCSGGVPNTCTPGAPTTETCNNLDDNCDGTIDNGSFSDGFEPNPDCGAARVLNTVNSDQTQTYNTMTVYPSGDFDQYRFLATETDSFCGCGSFSFDEDYQMNVTLSVPMGAGSYELCMNTNSCSYPAGYCFEVAAGDSLNIFQYLDGACPGQDDYTVYVRVRGLAAPALECLPYTLSYNFDAGLCR